MLTVGSESDGKDFAAGAGLHHVDGGIFHGEAAAEVAVDPLHESAFVGHGSFGDEVVNVVGPSFGWWCSGQRACFLTLISTTAE